jgi:hypothetical protein
MIQDASCLKLHTPSSGLVWYADGLNPAECSNMRTEEFLSSHIISPINLSVRILGVPQNAELITALYSRKKQRKLGSIYLAGPNVCESLIELDDPPLTFRRMRDAFMATSCGGWHHMTDTSAAIYALILRIQRQADWFDIGGRIYYETHPLYRVINFITDVNHRNVAQLLATIIDPRWYVDRRRPDNPHKLSLFLGLTPKTQKRVSDLTRIVSRGRDLRCAMVLNCWKTKPAADVDLTDPANFLWRIYRANGGGAKGDLRASQSFIGYLRTHWLAVVSSNVGMRQELFLPERFFKADSESQAYYDKMA